MTDTDPTPAAYGTTRTELQRVATHVLARARAAHSGRFGLRVTPGGIATPAFGDDERVVRTAGTLLVVERQTDDGRTATVVDLTGTTLAGAAAFAGVPLDEPFAPGGDAPPVGDPDAPLGLDPASVDVLCDWLATGARALDAVLPHLDGPSGSQLWPEHFDLGTSAATVTGGVNLGVSPGDAGQPDPYLYVGPWTDDRPGASGYWNASFGAVATRTSLLATGDPVAAGVAFFVEGLSRLAG